MLLLEDFEIRRREWDITWDSIDCTRVNKSLCLVCTRASLIYMGARNPETGRGFAVCYRCGVVEELWIDRYGKEY